MSENRSKRISQLPITQYPQISGSTVIVQDGVTYQTSYENIKNNIFPMDQEVTSGSTNPVASSGIYQAIDQSKVDVDQEVTSGSTNPVASSGIYQAIDELNVPNADKVGDNTTPINTDRTYFYNTISGWFYVAWEKMVRLLRGGSGAFAQPVYLTNIDSDITGYKVLSYNNDVDLSEVSISTDDDPVVYLYPDGLGLETLPNGPYFFSFRVRLSSTVGDTTLRITSFVRDSLGNERDLFTTQTNDINSSSYVDIGIRVLEPSYVVNPSERYGIRVSAITTHATTKTVTYQVGDGYSAYFTTPIALRHELLRGRDELYQHPAKSIYVDEVVSEDYSEPISGDTIQNVVDKTKGIRTSHSEYVGFENRTDSVIRIDATTGYTFVIEPVTDSYVVYVGKKKLTITTPKSVDLPNDLTLYYITINSDGVLDSTPTVWDLTNTFITPVAIFFRDGDDYRLSDERHGYLRNLEWHKWAHLNIGAMYRSGLGGSFDDDSFSISRGQIADEDIIFDTESTKTTTTLWYRHTTLNTMRLIGGSSTVYPIIGGSLAYDNNGTLTPISPNHYGVYWVYCSNDVTEPIYTVVSQQEYPNLSSAEESVRPTIYLSTAEWKLLYKVIYRNTNPITFIESSDFRSAQTGAPTSTNTQTHNALSERDVPNTHPAKSITVSETPIPIYSGVTIDDTLQEVSNKVLGVQQSKLEHTESTVFPNPTLLKPGDEFWNSNTMTLYKVYDNNGTNIWVQDKNTSFHQYKVLDPVVPSYENVTGGDVLQNLANKVAGLQDLTYRKLYEIEITGPIAFIDITKDLEGNDLDLRLGFKVSYYLLADADALYISGIQINGITDEVYEFTNLGRNYLIYYGSRFGASGGINLSLNGKNPDIAFHYRCEYGTSQPGTITGDAYSMRIRQNIESITSLRLLTDGYLAGSKIVIYGA